MSVTMISDHKCTESKSTSASWNVTSSCSFSLPYHLVNWGCVLHHFKQEICPAWRSRSHYAILAYFNGTTSKHQRAMWPELYWKLIVFLCIVVWHMSVCSLVWGYGEGCSDVIKNAAKGHFYFEILKFASKILWQPTDEDVTCMWYCRG